jgi:pimeloyl-ACP methyl ester carboxylesterase
MIWKDFVNRVAITSRRRGLSTAVVYGLSLAVRFTSATGEEVEVPAQKTQPVLSIMTRGAAQLPYQDWAGPNAVQPIVFRHGWPSNSTSCGM